MTFEYSAEELGLDRKISPKFLDIRRLRPLDNNQPWGIFFIAFDETKLPVVALRRLLSKLALTKRSTSNTGEHASWNANDLLLISQTGSNDGKSISFAHFASNPAKTDLPTPGLADTRSTHFLRKPPPITASNLGKPVATPI